MLIKNIKMRNINPELLSGYTKTVKYGSKLHGGCGIGLERLIMLFLDLQNVRQTSLFPRDHIRLRP